MAKSTTFTITAEENAKIEEWVNTHNCTIVRQSCCGGELSFIFTPTGIGTVVEVQCLCGAKKVIREIE